MVEKVTKRNFPIESLISHSKLNNINITVVKMASRGEKFPNHYRVHDCPFKGSMVNQISKQEYEMKRGHEIEK